MELGLRGKRVLVTGSYRGTGRAIAHAFAAEGAHVAVHGPVEHGAAVDDAVAEMVRVEGKAHGVTGDLLTDEGADELARRVGTIDVLVCNYGLAEGGAWFDDATDDAAWFDSYNKNVLSAVRLVRRLTSSMREQRWGRILLLGTVGSIRPGTRQPQYYAAKGALPAITTSLAKELAGTGITVNLVSPGIIATQEVRERFTERARRKGLATDWPSVQKLIETEFSALSSARITEPRDVADLVLFLASERADCITGANYRIDGGAADAVTP